MFKFFSKKISKKKLKNGDQIFTLAGFARSYGITVDKQNNIYVPDMQAHNFIVLDNFFQYKGAFDIKNNVLINCSRFGVRKKRDNNSESLVAPHYISFDQDDNIYIAEFTAGRVSKFSKDRKLISRFYNCKKPVSIFVENNESVFITDYEDNNVINYNPISNKYRIFIDKKSFEKKSSLSLDRPHGFYKGPDKNYYLADTFNHRIIKFDSKGSYVGWCGINNEGKLIDNWASKGTSKSSDQFGGFNLPVDLKIKGNTIYIADMKNHRIVRMNLKGKTIGVLDKISDDSLYWRNKNNYYKKGLISFFNEPYGIALKDNKLLVSDTNNDRVVCLNFRSVNL